MSQNKGALHLIAPLPEPRQVVERALTGTSTDVSFLDLSAGQPKAPSTLREDTRTLLSRSKKNIAWQDGQVYTPALGDASRRAYVDWLSEQSDAKLAGGKSIKEWFTYNGEVSLWWFTAMARKHPVVHPYRWLFYMIFVLDHVLDEQGKGEETWHLWVKDRATGQALKKALRGRRPAAIHVGATQAPPGDESRGQASRGLWQRVWDRVGSIADAMRNGKRHLRRVLSSASERATQPSRKESTVEVGGERDKPLVLLSTLPSSWEAGAPSGRVPHGVQCADRYFGDAPWRLQARGLDVCWLPRTGDYEQWKPWREGQTLPDAFAQMSVPLGKIPTLLFHYVKWLLAYAWLFEWQQVHEKWRYENIPLGSWLKEEFWDLCRHTATTQWAVGIERYRAVCDALQPDAILYRDEFYPTGRQLAAAAKGRAALIGVQHGMINREHTVYQFGPGDIQRSREQEPVDHIQHCPAPDAFASFGDYYREHIEEWSGYPQSRVASIGGIRHDALAQQFPTGEDSTDELSPCRIGRQHSVRESIGLPVGRPVVLLCTGQPHRAGGWFEMVIEASRKAEVTPFVAVKPHPSRGGARQLHDAARQKGFADYALFETEIYSLIYSADLLVAGGSTTVLEACLLGTPAAMITANEKYEVYPFSAEGIGEAVANAGDMASTLDRCLAEGSGQNVQGENSRRKRERILRRHLYNADGAACHRLASLIKRNIASF